MVNAPNGTLEVFRIGIGTLKHMAHIRVGMEPVAVAARTDDEVWVVSVSSMRKGHPLADSAHGDVLAPPRPGIDDRWKPSLM